MENRLKDFLHKNKRWDGFLEEFKDDLVSGEPVLGILYSHNDTFVSDGVSVPQIKFDFSPSSLLFVYSPYTATNSALSYSDIRGYFRLYSSNDLKGTGLQNLWDSLSELNEQKVSGEELDTLEEKINTQLNSYYATKGYVTSTFSDNYVEREEIGRAGGVAYLDSSGKIPLRNLYESQSIRVLKAGNETEHLTLGASIGDFVLRTDQDRVYIRSSDTRGMAAYEVVAYRKASDLIFTPYGNLLSTNIQKAIEELEDNKVAADDPRLSDSRTPNAHSSTHSSQGSDPLSPSDIGASSEDHDHDYAPSSHVNSLEHPEATSTSRGFMSSSHFNKLESVEERATADQSSQEILDSLKTVDGSGSGLDADLLDGNNSSAFSPAGHTHDYAPSSHVGSRDGHPLATPTQNGLYPAADKQKLDSIPGLDSTFLCELTRNQNQNTSNNTHTLVVWETAKVNPRNWWSPAQPTQIIPGAVGVYLVQFYTVWENNSNSSNGRRDQFILVNGSHTQPRNYADPRVNPNAAMSSTYIVNLTSTTDYIELLVRQDSGGTLVLLPTVTAIVARML